MKFKPNGDWVHLPITFANIPFCEALEWWDPRYETRVSLSTVQVRWPYRLKTDHKKVVIILNMTSSYTYSTYIYISHTSPLYFIYLCEMCPISLSVCLKTCAWDPPGSTPQPRMRRCRVPSSATKLDLLEMSWRFPKSWGVPQSSSILVGISIRNLLLRFVLVKFSIMNHPFWGTPISGNPHMLHVFACPLPVDSVHLEVPYVARPIRLVLAVKWLSCCGLKSCAA